MKIAAALEVRVDAVLYGPKVPQSRRAARRRMAAGGCLLALTAGAVAVLHPLARAFAAARYVTVPNDLLSVLLDPAIALLLGWCALQAAGLLLGARPLKERPWVKNARIGLLALLAACAALVCPYVVWALGTLFDWAGTPGGGWTFPAGAFYLALLTPLLRLNFSCPAVYALFGAALWGLGFPRTGGTEKPSGGDVK